MSGAAGCLAAKEQVMEAAGFAPFTRVLARDLDDEPWEADIFLRYDLRERHAYVCARDQWLQAIGYEGNEYLLGRTEHPEELEDGEKERMEISYRNREEGKERCCLAEAGGRFYMRPFTEVLARAEAGCVWEPDIFIRYDHDAKYPHWRYVCFNDSHGECVPYAGNEDLLGTSLPAPKPAA